MALTVRDFLTRKSKTLQLDVLTGDLGLDREIVGPEVSSPGLVLDDAPSHAAKAT